MIGWRDLGCLRRAMLWEGRAELIRGWMTSQNCSLAAEGKAEACCAMRMREAPGVRGGLHSDDQLRWGVHREQLDTHQEEGTVAGCQRRRPGSVVARDRRAATSELGHSRVVAAERRDGGGRGAARAMDGRCFLRAREHVLAQV